MWRGVALRRGLGQERSNSASVELRVTVGKLGNKPEGLEAAWPSALAQVQVFASRVTIPRVCFGVQAAEKV